MANNVVVSFHRSRALAQRKANRIGGNIVARRSGTGKFSKRGHYFAFVLEPKELTRYTVGITFPYKKEYGSVLAQLYTSKPWKPALRTERDKGATRESAIRKVEEVVKYPRDFFWFDLKGATAIETVSVDFDKNFAERIVVISEVDDESETTFYRRK